MRLYYAIRSKIVHELDLEDLPKKISFLLSLPVYVGYYSYIGLRSRGMKGVKAVLEGLFDGLRSTEELKYVS